MMHVKVAFALLALAIVYAQAKPSHPFGFHQIPDHLDLVPPILPPTQFHAAAPAPLFPQNHEHFLPSAGPFLPAPAPIPFLSAPAPLLPASAQFLPTPAHFVPASAPLLPTPFLHTHAQLAPAPAPILPPVYEAVPFAEPLPSYRAIPGPKTTTHHVSVGYAFPQPSLAKLHPVLHGHVHSVPLTHHHQHLLF